jgi:AAHS family 4-hydroxybenzoate transporter-like MFS transporter
MVDQPVVPVSRLLDKRGLGTFQIVLLIWSLFLVLIDGYDIAAIAFAAPHLVKAWGVSPKALGPVFSASLVGILFGSALFGWIGDRYGRKASLIGANLVFGVFTLSAAYASNLEQMFWLRLLAGLGIGPARAASRQDDRFGQNDQPRHRRSRQRPVRHRGRAAGPRLQS